MKKLLLIGVLAFGVANADIIPALDVGSAGVSAGFAEDGVTPLYNYTYIASVNSNAELRGDRGENEFFTLHDFPGFVSIANVVPNTGTWTVVAPGKTAAGVTLPTNDPGIPDLTLAYTGPTVMGGGTPFAVTLTTDVGPFYRRSYYSSQATNAFLPDTYTHGWGSVLVPSFTQDEPGEVPEPLTMGLIGGGLAAMGLLRRLRKA